MNHLNQDIRVAIDENNPSVTRIENRCIMCGECARVCSKVESVNNNYKLSKAKEPICVNCGQCIKVCPANSLCVKEEYNFVKEQIANKDKIVIVSTSPSVRVALGDEFGLRRGSFVQGKMVALLKKLGFKYVLDTNFSADVTICEEASELISRIKSKANLPQFTSCCPAWVKFAETFYPELLPNISSCKSPIGMQGALVKTYFAKNNNLNPENIVHVVVTPCTAKKFEIRREEFNVSSKKNNVAGMRDTDYCITTTELAKWAKEQKIDFEELEEQEFDSLMGEASGAGIIFGNSGGVMEAALRTAYYYITGNEPTDIVLDFKPMRGVQGIKEAEVNVDGTVLKLACVSGLANARVIIDKIKAGEKYDFVEVMTCPGGCIGGGGQPKHLGDEVNTQRARQDALYQRDKQVTNKTSHTNKELIDLYNSFLNSPNSSLAKELLHTKYFDRSSDLG